jgi:hypothetical protein
MTDELFSRNRIDFKLERAGKWWQLYYLRKSGRWESLSIWSTRDEAMEAAACFVPSPSLT